MAYIPIPVINPGDSWNAANGNTYLRDNFAVGVPAVFTAAGDLVLGSGVQTGVVIPIGVGDGKALLVKAANPGKVEWAYPDHGLLLGLGDDDHAIYYNAARHTVAVHDALGLDHGTLTGKSDDDHTIYLLRQPAANVVINDAGSDYDFRIEGDTDANLLFLDAGNDRVGIGKNNPSYKLDVTGDINATGVYRVGGVQFGPARGCRVYPTGAQTLTTSGTVYAIAFGAERWDNASYHDNVTNNSYLTIPEDGWYLIFGGVVFAANNTGSRDISIRVNGTTYIALERIEAPSDAARTSAINISTIYYFTAGEYVELCARQYSGGSLNTVVSDWAEFGIIKII